MLEKAVEAHLVKCVKALGGICWKLMFIGITGAPDRLVVLPGPRIHLVELKRPTGGKLRPRQLRIHSILSALGWPPVTLYSKPEVDRWINSI